MMGMKMKKYFTRHSLINQFIYSFGINIYDLAIKASSLWSLKAKKWSQGRKNNLNSLESWRKTTAEEVLWFHCASHGEYEQGLPLIQHIKEKNPQLKIALTFFSPSGYDAVKHNNPADWVGYIPIDLKSKMETFITTMNPSKVIFIKNDSEKATISLKEIQNG